MSSDNSNVSGVENMTLNTKEVTIDTSTLHFSYFVCLGIIIFMGYISNSLSIAVFIKSKALRQTTTGLYLLALAVADTLFLVGQMLRWLGTSNYIPSYTWLEYSDASCQFTYALRYSAKLTSAWITVVITAERFFIIAFPLKVGSVCTRKNALIAIGVTYGLWFTVGSLVCLTLKLVEHNGALMCGYHGGYRIYNWIVLRVCSLLLPGIIIMVLTIIICVKLVTASNVRKRELTITCASKQASSVNIQRQLTAMLLTVAISFVVLRLPYTICFYINDLKDTIWPDIDEWGVYKVLTVYKVTDLFAALNYALNFFLYCLSGTAFRKQFLSLCGCDVASGRPLNHTGHGTLSTKLGMSNTHVNRLHRGFSKTDDGHMVVQNKTNPRLSPHLSTYANT